MKTIRVAVGSIVITSALALSLVAPATAHTVSEAVRYGCGSEYSEVRGSARNIMIGTAVWGQVHLAYHSSTGSNCVVTRKIAYHNVPSRVRAYLVVQGVGEAISDDPRAAHWTSHALYGGRGRCVKYAGAIWNPAETVVARGNEPNWRYCRP